MVSGMGLDGRKEISTELDWMDLDIVGDRKEKKNTRGGKLALSIHNIIYLDTWCPD